MDSYPHRSSIIFRLINYAVVFVMVGKTYQHFFWYTPYQSFLWTEDLFTYIASLFALSWDDLISNSAYQMAPNIISILFGIFFLATALHLIISKEKSLILIKTSAFILIINAVIDWYVEGLYSIDLFEKTALLSAPIVFIALLENKNIYLIIKVVIAVTFISHGLEALQIFMIKGNFLDMTIAILHINEYYATVFLKIIGLLDIIFSLLLFYNKTERISWIYIILWGFTTAFARIVAHFAFDNILISLHQWTFEFLLRAPHFLLPMAGFMIYQSKKLVNGQKSTQHI